MTEDTQTLDELVIDDFVEQYKKEINNLLPGTRVIYMAPFKEDEQERAYHTIYTYVQSEFGTLGIETAISSESQKRVPLCFSNAKVLAKLNADAFQNKI